MGFEIINKIKKEKGLTNAQIAKMSGVTLSTLDKITAGINTNPKLDTLQAICKVLDCRLDDFDDSPRHKNENDISADDIKLIRKYHVLDDHGKEIVDIVLEKEYDRSVKESKKYKMPLHLMPVAAHNDNQSEEQERLMREDLDEL